MVSVVDSGTQGKKILFGKHIDMIGSKKKVPYMDKCPHSKKIVNFLMYYMGIKRLGFRGGYWIFPWGGPET